MQLRIVNCKPALMTHALVSSVRMASASGLSIFFLSGLGFKDSVEYVNMLSKVDDCT